MNKILILGSGQIARAFKTLLEHTLGAGKTVRDVAMSSKLRGSTAFESVDILAECGESATVEQIADVIRRVGANAVVNALPFFMSERVALAAFSLDCTYVDFTEDDGAASSVYEIYRKNPRLTCAPKCGVAPGFVNYVGNSLVNKVREPHTLFMSVGALPQTVNYNDASIDGTYSLSWSVDGLVNEYLKPCAVKMGGRALQIPALTGVESVIIEGRSFEAAFTAGGAGTLVEDLRGVPNVYYKTLRYPGHFAYVADAVKRHHSSFDRIKEEFSAVYPFDSQDHVVVYAYCVGRDAAGRLVKESYHETFYGVAGLTAIQTVTAASALAVLELIAEDRVAGCIRHNHIDISDIYRTPSYSFFFKNRR